MSFRSLYLLRSIREFVDLPVGPEILQNGKKHIQKLKTAKQTKNGFVLSLVS